MWEETLEVLEYKLPTVFAGLSKLYREKYKGKVGYQLCYEYLLYLLVLIASQYQRTQTTCGAGGPGHAGQEHEQGDTVLPVLQGQVTQADTRGPQGEG